jgi:hypothetical protein
VETLRTLRLCGESLRENHHRGAEYAEFPQRKPIWEHDPIDAAAAQLTLMVLQAETATIIINVLRKTSGFFNSNFDIRHSQLDIRHSTFALRHS